MRGNIYFHREFDYEDGGVGKKFLILINNPQNAEPFIFLKTTSQQKDKPVQYGCHIRDKVFYIPFGKTYFEKNTWIQLRRIWVISFVKCMNLGIDKILEHRGSLNQQMTNEIANCLLKSSYKDIEPQYVRLIKRR